MEAPRTNSSEVRRTPNDRRRTVRLRRWSAAVATALIGCAATAHTAAAAPVTTTLAERVQAADVATKKAGSPYLWGAVGPKRFDCSGLVVFSYKAIKHPLAARTSQQFAKLGAKVKRAQLKKGDLVFTYATGYGHIGIYVGRNRYVHAPGPGRNVVVAALPGGAAFKGAVRP